MRRRSVVRPRGRAGRTHCGSWTKIVPAGLWATRLVCSETPRHAGRHYSRWCGYEWSGDEVPRRRS